MVNLDHIEDCKVLISHVVELITIWLSIDLFYFESANIIDIPHVRARAQGVPRNVQKSTEKQLE